MHVKLQRIFSLLTLVALVASFGIGCGGLSASQSVSPASFLLPGLGQNTPQKQTIPELAKETPPVAVLDAYSAQ